MNAPVLRLVAVLTALAFAIPASVSAADDPYLVRDLRPDGPSNPMGLVGVGSRVFFTANDGVKGRELYVSDGTFDGTRRVKDIWTGAGSANPSQLTPFGDRLVFVARDGVNGQGVYITDGTFGGTRRISNRRTCGTGIDTFVVSGGLLYFARYDSDPFACNLYATDGTAAGTQMIASNIPGFERPTAYAGRIFFTDTMSSHLRLWKTTPGIGDGFKLIKNFGLGSSLSEMVASGRFLYLAASTNDLVLWRSDGTKAGTKIVNGADGPIANPGSLTDFGGVLMFSGMRLENDTVVDSGLWRSKGTLTGTRLVKEFTGQDELGHGPNALTVIGNRLFFTSWRSVEPDSTRTTLWRSNATTSSTVPLLESGIGEWVSLGNKILFSGCNEPSCSPGPRLHVTDTNGATVAPLAGVWNVSNLTAAQTSAFFTAIDDGWLHPGELFRYVP